MSSRRIDADLGFLSLALAERQEADLPVCPEHRSADGLRLRALLSGPARPSYEDIPMAQEVRDGCTGTPRPVDQHQRLRWLAERVFSAHSSHKAADGKSVSLRLPPDLLTKSTLVVRQSGDRLVFELGIGDADACAWICDRLVALVDVMAPRISCPFVIRIMDTLSSRMVAEAGKERDEHPWHRTSICEN